MTRVSPIDPLVEELVKALRQEPRSPLLGGQFGSGSPSLRPSDAENLLLRVYRTQAADLWCDAALECLMESRVGKEVLFALPNRPFKPVPRERVERESTILCREPLVSSPLHLLHGLYSSETGVKGATLEQALYFAKISNRLFPTARAYMIAADVEMERGSLIKARALCRKGIDVSWSPADRAILLERIGVASRRAGDRHGYLKAMMEAQRYDPSNPVIHWNCLRASLELGLESFAVRAGEMLDRSLNMDPRRFAPLSASLSERQRARGTIADFAQHRSFSYLYARLTATARGLVDAFA